MTLQQMLEKYETRKEECDEQFDNDITSLKLSDNSEERIKWLHNDIRCLNVQISVYECIIKDLKELLNEASR